MKTAMQRIEAAIFYLLVAGALIGNGWNTISAIHTLF